MVMDDLTQSSLKQALSYDPETGIFRRKKTSGGWPAGKEVGSKEWYGHIRIKINRRKYYAHRLAWLYVYGEWPTKFLDHIDGNPSNNSIANLRLATNQQNQRNCRKYVSNTSGLKGVSEVKSEGRWKAQIRINGRRTYLGIFDTPEEAHEAYCAAGRKHFGEFFNDGKEQQS